MIAWDRRHNNTDTELIFKYDGFLSSLAEGCCIIRLDDDGSQTSVILRLDDPGDGSSCIEPLSCQDE